MASQNDAAVVFRAFAEREAKGISPLYQALAEAVAQDPDLLALAQRARPGQPLPNMLLASVHALLLSCPGDEPLAGYYRSLTPDPLPPEGASPVFRRFCLDRGDELKALLVNRAVGTNETARAALLRPAFAAVAARAPAPLHLIEVGASAGLLLLWDRYRIDYGGGCVGGPEDSPLRIACPWRGGTLPDFVLREPAVGLRLGIDPQPMDPEDEADRAWLRALIWPEQTERRQRLQAALELAQRFPPDLREGDALDLLPRAFAEVPSPGTVCVFHAFTLNQFSSAAKAAFQEQLVALSRDRPFFAVALEWGEGDAPELRLKHLDRGTVSDTLLARCDAHGAWIEWAGT